MEKLSSLTLEMFAAVQTLKERGKKSVEKRKIFNLSRNEQKSITSSEHAQVRNVAVSH
jgi:hypothetical protein